MEWGWGYSEALTMGVNFLRIEMQKFETYNIVKTLLLMLLSKPVY